MNAKTNPLPEDVVIVPTNLPPAVNGLVFYATKTPNTYLCVDAGVAFPLRFIVDADGARGVCGCGVDMPCTHISTLYALPTPPVDPAPQLISAFFVGTEYAAPTAKPHEPPAQTEEPKTGIATITKSGVKVSLRAKVVQLWDTTSPAIGQVGLLADDADKIKFVKWANAGLPDVVEGGSYDFGNMLTDEYNGKMSVKLDKKSTIVPVTEQDDEGDLVHMEPTPEPEPNMPEQAPKTPPTPPVINTVVCKYCGEELDRSDPDAVLNHIEKCKHNNNPQVAANMGDKKNVSATTPATVKETPAEVGIPKQVAADANVVSPPAPDPMPVPVVPAMSPQVGGISNIAMAMCRVQQTELSAVTDSNNPFHNSMYADLSSVWAAIRKPLTDNGLCVIQTTEPYDGGITVVTTLMHISGEMLVARLSCEVPGSKPDKNGQVKPNIQGLGSTITYLRRYSLGAMIGVCPVDDDGEAAHGR